jgi:hypothetical protein
MVRPARPGLAVNLYEWFHERTFQLRGLLPNFCPRSAKAAGFIIQEADALIMWGWPVEIILARNQLEANHESRLHCYRRPICGREAVMR